MRQFSQCHHIGYIDIKLCLLLLSQFSPPSLKVVQYKQQSRLEEKRKKALDLQLDFIVGQTEKYSDLLSQSLAPAGTTEPTPSPPKKSHPSTVDEDGEKFVFFFSNLLCGSIKGAYCLVFGLSRLPPVLNLWFSERRSHSYTYLSPVTSIELKALHKPRTRAATTNR